MCMKMKWRAAEDEFVEPVLIYLIVLLNALAFIVGIGFIIGGSWLIYLQSSLTSEENIQNIFDLAIDLGVFLIIIGIFIIILSLIGIVASVRQHKRLLIIYSVALAAITIACMVTGVVFLIFSGKITASISNKLQGSYLQTYFDDSEVRVLMDTIQGRYNCCGINDYTDWAQNPYYNCSSTKSVLACFVPDSCCVDYYYEQSTINLFCSGSVLNNPLQTFSINTNGCSGAINSLATFGIYLFSGVLIGLSVLLLVMIGMVQYLVYLIKKEMALHNSKVHYMLMKEIR